MGHQNTTKLVQKKYITVYTFLIVGTTMNYIFTSCFKPYPQDFSIVSYFRNFKLVISG